MTQFRLAEVFLSINGEGPCAGELAVFLRFQGCNLQCSYCDTRWANDPETPVRTMTTQELVQEVQHIDVQNVTLTGGEPLLQPGITELMTALGALGYRVEVETNGSVDLAPYASLSFRPCFTMDYKLPDSGMESHMREENFQLLQARDAVKFVVGSHRDLVRASEIITGHQLTARCGVYLSPVYGKLDPAQIVAFMKEHLRRGVRLQLQLHKYIWDPEQRGV